MMKTTITLIVKPNNPSQKALQITVFILDTQIHRISSFYYEVSSKKEENPQFNLEISTLFQIKNKPKKIISSISSKDFYINFDDILDIDLKDFLFSQKIKELHVPAISLSSNKRLWRKEMISLISRYSDNSFSTHQLIQEYVSFIKRSLDVSTSERTEVFSKSFKL